MVAQAPFRVLAIDGGGIRGIIPATVLAELERRIAPRRLLDVFGEHLRGEPGELLAGRGSDGRVRIEAPSVLFAAAPSPAS